MTPESTTYPIAGRFAPSEVIRRKRDNGILTAEELRGFVAGVVDGSIPDYQAAAMLMAIFWRGLSKEELAHWTAAMVGSGETIDFSGVPAPKVDKHSTGGVGDKISLPLAPAVAACGIAVPMIAGRGLGHTGGTLDKLESIPGFRVDLDIPRFREIVAKIGACLIGATERIAPADRKLYALRDVTATVDSIPLIASSIMAKKLAAGLDALVLDCKVGSGAFMKTKEQARELATTIQTIGRQAGKRVTALLTSMEQPIGWYVGNALEVEESIDVLKGGGPGDTRSLVIALGAEMLVLGNAARDAGEGATVIARTLDDGRALEKMREIVVAQGGDPRVCDSPAQVLPQAPARKVVLAPRAGTVVSVDAAALGRAMIALGGGRQRKEDAIDHAVGIRALARLGERVEHGQPLAEIHCRTPDCEQAVSLIRDAYGIDEATSTAEASVPPMIMEVLR
ncbi:MAG: thymidine phosphorylase [Pseudomonadota bacterium]